MGGTVEGDDGYEATMLREAQEELGLKNIKAEIGPKQFISTPCNYFVQWYSVVIDQPLEFFTIQPEEVEQVAWIPRKQLEEELRTQPQKYIDVIPEILALF